MFKLFKTSTAIACTFLFSQSVIAEEAKKEVQDMSDPLAVYTQAGGGFTNKGVNIKIGQSYDTGNDETMAMRVVEIKGIYGDALGWDESASIDNSVDSIRFRNFEVNLTNGRGSQIDVNYNLDANHLAEQSGDFSYSIIQALPKMGVLSLYPLLGAGAAFGNNVVEDDGSTDSGYSVYGTFALIGLYSKIAITDELWINYNPFYVSTLSGSGHYKNNAFGVNNDTILLHEFVLSYQINPRLNVRYFANWSEYNNFGDGDQRIEVNYQL